jgi:hypothetical protein
MLTAPISKTKPSRNVSYQIESARIVIPNLCTAAGIVPKLT